MLEQKMTHTVAHINRSERTHVHLGHAKICVPEQFLNLNGTNFVAAQYTGERMTKPVCVKLDPGPAFQNIDPVFEAMSRPGYSCKLATT